MARRLHDKHPCTCHACTQARRKAMLAADSRIARMLSARRRPGPTVNPHIVEASPAPRKKYRIT